MENSQDLNRKTLKKCRKTVDVQKVMEIVEGGFNTLEINAAFDYDLVLSDDDSSNSGIISSEESENSIDYDQITVIPPTPKKRKRNDFVSTSEQQISRNTCSETSQQHVHGVSGINEQNIHKLSEQPTLNRTSQTSNSTSPYHISTAEEPPPSEHDKIVLPNSQPEHVFTISLDTEVPPQPDEHQTDILQSGNENATFPLLLSTTNIPNSPNNEHNTSNDNIDLPDEEDYYIIEYNGPSSPPPNHQIESTQIENCEGDTELEEDIENGWHKVTNDTPRNNPEFMDTPGLNFDTDSREPKVFFNQLFDDHMFTIIAEETNNYAHQQISKIMDGRDEIQQIEHHSHRRHARLGTWRDLNEADIKIFIGHILVMSSVRKPALHNYRSTTHLSRTPFFGTYLSQNKFQDILWNLHVADTNNNPPPGVPNHDPLAKVCPLVTMCQNNFRLQYTPSEFLSVDESTLAFKVKYTINIWGGAGRPNPLTTHFPSLLVHKFTIFYNFFH